MAKEKGKEDESGNEPATPETPAGKPNGQPVPVATPAIVEDNSGKEIRKLQTKIADSEKNVQTLKEQLAGLEDIVKKAGEVKAAAIQPAQPNQTVLGYLENLIFKPKQPK